VLPTAQFLTYPYVCAQGKTDSRSTLPNNSLSPSVRRALRGSLPAIRGKLEWRMVGDGFEAGELAVMAEGSEVDRILIARIDPAKFRFEVHNAPAGDPQHLDGTAWRGARHQRELLFPQRTPNIPLLSAGTRLGPTTYAVKAGAFVASAQVVAIRDFAPQSCQEAFKDADAMVSYSLDVRQVGT
jgi:hypothetical protein